MAGLSMRPRKTVPGCAMEATQTLALTGGCAARRLNAWSAPQLCRNRARPWLRWRPSCQRPMDELGPLRRAFSCGEGCVRPVPRLNVVASIDRPRFAPRVAGFSVPLLLRMRGKPRDLANRPSDREAVCFGHLAACSVPEMLDLQLAP